MNHSKFEWRKVSECIMGSFLIALVDSLYGNRAYFRQGFKDIHIQHFISVRAIESFHIGILPGLSRLDKFEIDCMLFRPVGQRR